MVVGCSERQEISMKLKFALAGALLTFGLATPALAAPGGHGPNSAAYHGHRQAAWELIGSQNVSLRKERDTVFARGNDRHRQIMICVYRAPVRMFDVDVRFKNGGHQDVAVRNTLKAGTCTRAIDLKGKRRDIRTVSMVYKTIPGFKFGRGAFGQSAVVRVYAR
jgi:hypothetical protein